MTDNQARLPEHLKPKTIANMKQGIRFYTLPWAMLADADELLWLKPLYPVTLEVRGTSNMAVELREDGYHVWPVPDMTYVPCGKGHGKPVAVLEGCGCDE